MGKLRDFYARLKENGTVEKQNEWLIKLIRSQEAFLVDLNTGQLMMGKDSKGGNLRPYKLGWYEEFKKYLNPAAHGIPDLRLTGAFHNSFYVDVSKFPEIEFNARDPKTGKLAEGFDNIFGLNDESKQVFREHVKGDIINYYKELFRI